MTIRALVVDDEPLAREGVRRLLADEPDVRVIGESRNGRDAVAAIADRQPDLVFLDVQMPELDGFEVLTRIDPDRCPAVIFVTAYDEYALRAFHVHAVDYLLKPIDPERFEVALKRARAQLQYRDGATIDRRVLELLTEIKQDRERIDRFMVKTRGAISFVKDHEIDWIEAAGNYVRLHVGTGRHLMRETMSALEQRLDPGRFLRIHRSTIVNLDRIREIQPGANGEHVVILADGQRLGLSRTYRERLHTRLGRI